MIASFVLLGWIPCVLFLFLVLPPTRAALTAYILGWLFLPMAAISVPGFPDYTKVTATSLGVLCGLLLFDLKRFLALRPALIDLPICVWTISPFLSSVSNGLGAYDGLSAVFTSLCYWGIPYVVGRVCIDSVRQARELAIAILLGGLVYVPFCLYEIRMSPQLHYIVYGFHQHSFAQTHRAGGWRPMVFMQHGLMVGLWMASSALIGAWLVICKALRSPQRWVQWLLVSVLLATALMCKSLGAAILLVAGLAALLAAKWLRTTCVVALLIFFPPAYVALRIAHALDLEWPVKWSEEYFGQDRAQSLAFRIANEEVLMSRAFLRPIFGWGGWGRSRVHDQEGEDTTVADSLWIQAFGRQGFVGLIALISVPLAALACHWWRFQAAPWCAPGNAAICAIASVVCIYAVDNLFNSMENPVLYMCVGALASLCLPLADQRRRSYGCI